ncbi:E3 ubiquitin-protein ligase LUL4 [Tripterygium wilfordii]|uniref:RING-type E3 ubiquitin transferase n=1 Tax=Tripterygium wilfordii TaxID=458696 RepID=A0A7J7CRU7_TRIWF|nr:probable E3 ubiquitin-protein ligase LUL4 [Tripterygium wilfordii]XP_038723081.1 probable E3 ubiquitin-protein ligase LUL4 [Tripterygium wilfordii]KAF5736823.1 E3 ubiquitin-protein ligase LUL4 [Tripterygium wilfordii]
MGISWSTNRRRNRAYPPPPLAPPPYYHYSTEPPPLPPHNYHFTTTNSSTATPYPFSQNPPPPPPPPPVHPYYNSYSYGNHSIPRYNHHHYHYHQPYNFNYAPPQTNGWPAVRAPAASVQSPLPPYVEHQNAKKIRNDVNVHKDTLRVEIDEQNPDQYLVSFVFDALFDGSITILYFAKEESDCRFVPLFPEAYMPVKIPFRKGLGQRFCQPSGTGIDLGFFELDDLRKPSAEEDIFPLVVSAETCSSTNSIDEPEHEKIPVHMQITQAVLEKNNDDLFQVKVIRQILWIDGVRYELREIFGIASSSAEEFNDSDTGKECVICMTDPKDTAVLPCRHMCMCSECAKALRLQSNKCPICRQPIEELIEIKINNSCQ